MSRLLIMMVLFSLQFSDTGRVLQQDNSDYTGIISEIEEEFETQIPFEEIDGELRGTGINFKDVYQFIKNREFDALVKYIFEILKMGLFNEPIGAKRILFTYMMIIITSMIFGSIASTTKVKFTEENYYYVLYMVTATLVLTLYKLAISILEKLITNLVMSTKILLPAYMISHSIAGEMSLGRGLAFVIMIGIFFAENVIKGFVIPLLDLYIVLILVNGIGKDDMFGKLIRFIKDLISWTDKTIIAIVIGINVIKEMIDGPVAAASKVGLAKVLSAIPGGNLYSGILSVALGAGSIIKGTIGAVGIFIIVILLATPVIKLFIMLFLTKVMTVFSGLSTEKRLTSILEKQGDAIGMIMYTGFISAAIFMICIAMMARGGAA